MKIDLTDFNVLVTGASRGIGESIARHFASCGASVAVHYFKNQKRAEILAAEIGNGSFAIGADLNNPVAVQSLAKGVIAKMGSVNALVNNAAICTYSSLESEDWVDKWNETLSVNLSAVALLTREFIFHFKSIGGGKIVNISSRAVHRGDTSEYLAYVSSKGGLLALSKSIAKNYGKDGITCFAISPGFVETDMSKPFIDAYGMAHLTSDLALDELTQPDDVAPMVVFLSSGMADHATGTDVQVNAGSYMH